MKKIVFGGFCMIGGILLFMLAALEPGSLYANGNLVPVIKILSILLFVWGIVLGVTGLRED